MGNFTFRFFSFFFFRFRFLFSFLLFFSIRYVTPELLEKGNQWECSQCEKKVDALKGLKFKELPQLLTLQLKRFDYNYSTMTRIKLNNRVAFPLYLNLNSYLKGDLGEGGVAVSKKSEESHSAAAASSSSSPAQSGEEELWECALCTYLNVPARRSCEMCATPRPQTEEVVLKDLPGYEGGGGDAPAPPPPPTPFGRVLAEIKDTKKEKEKSEGASGGESKSEDGDKETKPYYNSWSYWKTPVATVNEKELAEYEAESEIKEERPDAIGPNDYIYELFSVLVHSGSAMGGHYYGKLWWWVVVVVVVVSV